MINCSTVAEKAQILTENHLADWVSESGVDGEIAALNIESLSREETNERVRPKHPIKTGGWWCRGVNWRNGQRMGNRYGQLKPDEKHTDPENPDKKPAKYLTASGMEPDAIFLRMPDPDYWRKVYEDKSTPIIWTEGAKKAGAGLTHGYATIALSGVWNFGKGGKLAPDVEIWIKRGGEQYLAFDSDYREKPQCAAAIKRFCRLARQRGTDLLILDWDSQYKGMDDLIKADGPEAFEDAIFAAKKIEHWERQLRKDLETKSKPPTPREISREIGEDYQQNWKYHDEHKTWRYWNGKCWEEVGDGVFRSTVKTDIDGRGINYSKADYITNVVSLVTDDLRVFKWETLERFQYIPFENGVVSTTTGKLRKHNPDNGFTHFLPHKYNPVEVDNLLDTLREKCPNTYQYMMTAQQNNCLMVRKLLATVNGVITGKFSQLQLFVQLIGKTRAGKGTFTRLLRECVGAKNHASASLKDLARPEVRASIIDKMLVEFPEQRSTNEEAISWLLALTGGDFISCKRLYKDPTSEKFYGTPVLTSNRQIGTAKFPELDERLCLITFNNTVPKDKRIPNLDGLIKAEISQLIAIALSMGDAEVTQLLKGIGEGDNPEVKLQQWELKTEESVIAAFFNDRLIVEPGRFVLTTKLYEEFKAYCSGQGKQPLALKRFARELAELFEHLDSGVDWNKEARNSRFEGVRLREEWDTAPTYEEALRRPPAPIDAPIERAPAPVDAPIQTQTQKAIAPIAPIESKTFSDQIELSPDEIKQRGWIRTPWGLFDKKAKKYYNLDGSFKYNSPPAQPTASQPEPTPTPEKPKAQPKQTKPELANLHPATKDEWLWANRKTTKRVWVETEKYIGLATIYGEPVKGDKLKKWRFSPVGKGGLVFASPDKVSVLKSELGKFKEISKPPAGEQADLPLE